MEQETALQWLENNLIGNPHFEEDFRHNRKIFEQAKQMEKEQIMRACKDGISHGYTEGVVFGTNPRDYIVKWSEQYYNETYGK